MPFPQQPTFQAAIAYTVASQAVTIAVSRTNPAAKVTNNAAASVTITIATAGAVDGQPLIVTFYDATAAAQTITWSGTENSATSAPTTSNGSTTSPITVGFRYNAATGAWRCVAST